MSDSKLYLGIDGGGSKTSFLIENEKGEVVFQNIGEGTSLDTYSEDEIFERLSSSLKNAPKVDYIFYGLGGITSLKDEEKVNNIVKRLSVTKKTTRIISKNDVYSALYGGLSGRDGIIVILGTGSVSFGKRKGKFYRVGGYGYKEGDLGSSYDLGYKAIQELGKVLDRRSKESPLTLELKKELNIQNREDFVNFVNNATRFDIASLSRIVTKTERCYKSRYIIKRAAFEAFLLLSTCYTELHFKREEEVPFTLIGGLGTSNTLYTKELLKLVSIFIPNLKYVEKENEASKGSIIAFKEMKDLLC